MLKTSNLFKKSIAEFIGTFALVFAGCGAVMVHNFSPEAMPVHMIAPVFGLVVSAMIYSLGHVSGAHLNPAVTLAFASVKRFKWCEVAPYMAAQFLGALAAIFVLSTSLPHAGEFGTTLPHIGIWQSFLWEFILTFFLMFVIISVATDSRAVGMMAGAAIGATVMLDAFIGGPLTGASMNPARSFAPAIFANDLSTLWIYFVAPCLGAVSAAWVYEHIRCDKDAEKIDAKGCC